MRWPKRSGGMVASAPDPQPSTSRPAGMPGEAFTRVFITIDSGLVMLLTFAFMFGNGWETAQLLGVHPWIAPLIQPAVDLAVVGLMVGLRYLAAHGWTDEELKKPRVWLRIFGAMTLAMNTALPLHEGNYGRAAWDAIGPVLLIAWSELAPWLLRAFHIVRLAQEETAREAQRADVQPVPTAHRPEKDLVPLDELTAPREPESLWEPELEEPEPLWEPEPEEPDFPPELEPEPEEELAADERTEHRAVKLDTGRVVERYLISWSALGLTYADRPGAALFKAMGEDPDCLGMARPVGQRRINQLCQELWPELYEKGLVKTPVAHLAETG